MNIITTALNIMYPLIPVDRPDALLHDAKLADAQLFVDGDGIRRNDMFVRRRRRFVRLVHQPLVCVVVRVLPTGRRVELERRVRERVQSRWNTR